MQFIRQDTPRRPPKRVRTLASALIFALSLISGLGSNLTFARSELPMHFSNLGTDDGLSQGTVNAILQDDQGFIWLATEDGLDRYDGTSITPISDQYPFRGALPRNVVTSVVKDRFGTMWIGTDGGGLSSHNTLTGKITTHVEVRGKSAASLNEHIRAIYIDRVDRVWVATADAGLLVIDQTHGIVHRLRHDSHDDNSLSDDSIFAVTEDERGDMWIGTALGLDHLDPQTNIINRHTTRTNANIPSAPEGDQVNALLEDSAGVLWVGTSNGLLRLDPRVVSRIKYHHRDNDDSTLPSDSVTSLLEDQSHRIWIATSAGLALWNKTFDRFSTYRHNASDPSSLPADELHSLYQDRGGILWVGTESNGLGRWNPRSWSFGHHQFKSLTEHGSAEISSFTEDHHGTLWVGTLSEGLRAVDEKTGDIKVYQHIEGDPKSMMTNRVNSVVCAHDGSIWLSSRAGLSRLDPRTGQFEHYRADPSVSVNNVSAANNVIQVFEDSKERVWAAIDGAGLARFDPANKTFKIYRNDPANAESLPDNHVHAIAEDPSGKLWLGTNDGALALFDPDAETFHPFIHDITNPRSLSDAAIDAIHVDSRGTVWVGTLGGGLTQVIGDVRHLEAIRFRSYGQNEGLENSTVYGIESDANGSIWVSTNRGLARFDQTLKRFRSFHHSQGLQGEEFNEGAAYRLRNGQLLFGGPNGYNAFYPEKIQLNPHAPQLALIGYLKLNTRVATELPVERLKQVELGYRDSVVSFQFAALDYASPERNRYSYMLEGFDKAWVDGGNKGVATYTNLDGGKYVFKVRAANDDGEWSQTGITLPVSVESPPWATRLAKTIYGILLLLLVIAIQRFHRAKIRRETQYGHRLEIEVQTRTAALNAANQQLKQTSVTDPLTGLGNRRYLAEMITAHMKSESPENPKRLALMVLDLDRFKPINDSYGHEAGDRVIVQAAEILRGCCRNSDYLARWGGDEFVIVYLDTNQEQATILAEQIRSRVAKQIFRLMDGKAVRSSCSIGFCCYPFISNAPQLLTWEQTLAIADAGVNLAKTQRNQWVSITNTNSLVDLATSPDFAARLVGSINLAPTELERNGQIAIHRPIFQPEDTGAHLRVTGRRNHD